MATKEEDLSVLEAPLTAWLRAKMPQASDLSISPSEQVGSGFSNETSFFHLRWQEGGRDKVEHLVFRRPAQGSQLYRDSYMHKQFRVMDCLEDTDIPVSRTWWFEPDEKVLGFPFFIMEFVEGDVASIYPPGPHGHGFLYEATPERRAAIWRRLIEVLAKMNSLDWESSGLSFLGVPEGGADALDRQIAYWEDLLTWRVPVEKHPPVIRAAFDWLKKNRFTPSRVGLCWGDANLHNLIYRNDEIVAVMDWEMAHLGAPESDLAYLCWCDVAIAAQFGTPRLEGFADMQESVELYESLTGRRVENFLYHQVMQMTKINVVNVLVAFAMAEAGGMDGMEAFYEGGHPWSGEKLAELLDVAGSP